MGSTHLYGSNSRTFLEAVKPTFLSGKQQGLRMEMAVEEGVSWHPEMGRDSSRGDLRVETLIEQAREIQCLPLTEMSTRPAKLGLWVWAPH